MKQKLKRKRRHSPWNCNIPSGHANTICTTRARRLRIYSFHIFRVFHFFSFSGFCIIKKYIAGGNRIIHHPSVCMYGRGIQIPEEKNRHQKTLCLLWQFCCCCGWHGWAKTTASTLENMLGTTTLSSIAAFSSPILHPLWSLCPPNDAYVISERLCVST